MKVAIDFLGGRIRRYVLIAAAAIVAVFVVLYQVHADAVAHFVVKDRVVAPNPGAFTATVNGVGNGGRIIRAGSGFEPVIYRDWIYAEEDHPDRVSASAEAISYWNTLRTGALDGAEVDIFRVENGRFRHVRTSKIPDGGFQASGWKRHGPSRKVIPGDATSFVYRWRRWGRPDVPAYFTLRAIDDRGQESESAEYLTVQTPSEMPKKNIFSDVFVELKAKRTKALDPLYSPPETPTGFRVETLSDGSLEFHWDALPDQPAGYVLYRSAVAPEEHRGYYFDLESAPDAEPVMTGDMVLVRKKFFSASRRKNHTDRVWDALKETRLTMPSLVWFFPDEEPGLTWRLVPHDEDTPVEDAGETYLEVEMADNVEAKLGRPTNSGTAQIWYPVLMPREPYRVEMWLKADRPTRVAFRLTGFHGKKPQRVPPILFDVGTEWKKHEAIFTPLALNKGSGAGYMYLEMAGPASVAVDNLRVYPDDAGYLALRPDDAERLEKSGMSAIRTHALIKTGRRTYDLEQLTNPGGLPSGTDQQNSLPHQFEYILAAGKDPWLQIEPHLTPDEWRGFVEYIAAPYDPAVDTPETKPWAAKRYAQGRKEPWIDAFDKIYFEIGNESWNQLFTPWIFRKMPDAGTGRNVPRGAVYGMYHDFVAESMRSSPYWTDALEEKWVEVIGGFEHVRSFGAQAARHAKTADLVTTGAYIGGWEAKAKIPEDTPEDFFRLLTHTLQVGLPNAEKHIEAIGEVNDGRDAPVHMGTYEAGPGYLLNGLNGAQVTPEAAEIQERVMKSVAGGSATLDSFLARAQAGYKVQNFFTFGPGMRWRSHAMPYHGGQTYPPWMFLAAYNQYGTGDFLEVETMSVPRADLAERKRYPAMPKAPLIGLYATREGDRLTLAVISRRVPNYPDTLDDGKTDVTIDLPIEGAEKLTLIEFTGAYDTHNVGQEAVTLQKKEIAISENMDRLEVEDLMPGTTRFYVFEGIRQ